MRHLRAWSSLGLILLLALPALAKPTLQGRSGHWRLSEFVATSPQRAWAVLSQYEAQAALAPDISRAQVVSRSGREVVLEQTYKAGYTFGLPIRARLSIQEDPPRGFRYRLLQGEKLNALQGQWTITPVKGGIQLRHEIRVDPQVPPLLRPIYDQQQEANLVAWMTILKRRMEQAGGSTKPL